MFAKCNDLSTILSLEGQDQKKSTRSNLLKMVLLLKQFYFFSEIKQTNITILLTRMSLIIIICSTICGEIYKISFTFEI